MMIASGQRPKRTHTQLPPSTSIPIRSSPLSASMSHGDVSSNFEFAASDDVIGIRLRNLELRILIAYAKLDMDVAFNHWSTTL